MKCLALSGLLLLNALLANTQTLQLSSRNPHYFLYKGKPTVLITSAEHYGAVINSEFDYITYLDLLQKNNFNLTRVFVGSYCEGDYYDFAPGKKNNAGDNQNTLAVRPGKLIAPWARSDSTGYRNGGNRFDLDKWDTDYFKRLNDFCRQAARRNIIVEIVFFSANYGPATWLNSPLNAGNNINEVEDVAYNETHLPKNKKLIARQIAMIQKIVQELNEYDNIYYEICNEPYWIKGIPEVESTIKVQQFLPETDDWQAMIGQAIKTAELKLAKRHLIAQNFANNYFKIEKLDSNVSILNYHYAYPPKTVTDNYRWSKPVAFDETADGQNAPDRRREAWAFILAGGAVYNNLDWSWTVDDVTGLGRNARGQRQSGKEVREQLTILAKTIGNFDFIAANPVDSTYKQDLPAGINVYGLAIPGKDYLFYWIKNKKITIDSWHLKLRPGNYDLKWFDPIDGRLIKQTSFIYHNELDKIKIPLFTDDTVLRLKRVK